MSDDGKVDVCPLLLSIAAAGTESLHIKKTANKDGRIIDKKANDFFKIEFILSMNFNPCRFPIDSDQIQFISLITFNSINIEY
jgi:hypothetical protein